MYPVQLLEDGVVPLLDVLDGPEGEGVAVPAVLHHDEPQVEPLSQIHQMVSLFSKSLFLLQHY